MNFDFQFAVFLVYDDLLDQHSQMGIADGTCGNDLVEHIDSFLDFGFPLFDGFLEVADGIQLLDAGLDIGFTLLQHFAVHGGVFSVTEAFKQYHMLVATPLLQTRRQGLYLPFSGVLLRQPPSDVGFDTVVVLLRFFLDAHQFLVDQSVKLAFVDAVRGAVVLAVAVVSVAHVLVSYGSVFPFPHSAGKARAAVTAFDQPRVSVAGIAA